VATVDVGISDAPFGIVTVRGSGLQCPAGQFDVETVDTSGSLINTISFHLIVP
jgi:hypothetical protein